MKLDINTLVGQLAAERDIEPDKLIDAIAEAISSAARKQYKDRGVHTEIDPETGEVESWRIRMVVEEGEDSFVGGELVDDEVDALGVHNPVLGLQPEFIVEAVEEDREVGLRAEQQASLERDPFLRRVVAPPPEVVDARACEPECL